MDKLIIFDLDGVLIDSKTLHFDAFNLALKEADPSYVISKEDHKNIYEGLPTTEKLKILTIQKNLPESMYQKIWDIKQKHTMKMLEDISEDQELKTIISFIKENNFKVAVASNSIKETIITVLKKIGIFNDIDFIVGNEDVLHPKPHPEMYWKCMSYFNTVPDSTIIFEDSVVGKVAVYNSKAKLVHVENRKDLTLKKVSDSIETIENSPISIIDKTINILIPMAGAGSRFADAGYSFPKPLIDINGKTMIELVVKNLGIKGNYIFLVQKEHYNKYNLQETLELISPNCKIVQVDSLTEGAACTSLLAKNLIDNDNPLIIANSDQYVEWDNREFLYNSLIKNTDGSILLFKSSHPKWSYAKLNDFGLVSEVAEKKPISDNATVGIYFWSKGSDYVKYAEQMINKDIRTNNEFYICPVYNEAIEDGKKIGSFFANAMWGLGTPEDLNLFLRNKND